MCGQGDLIQPSRVERTHATTRMHFEDTFVNSKKLETNGLPRVSDRFLLYEIVQVKPRTQTSRSAASRGWESRSDANEDGLHFWDEEKFGDETVVMGAHLPEYTKMHRVEHFQW